MCEGGVLPAEETCDGDCVDEDCDGIVDQIARTCYPWGGGCDIDAGICAGSCALGLQTCACIDAVSTWGACEGAQGPEAEACNGLDDDCDGVADDAASCPGGGPCIEGGCALPCDIGLEFSCPVGTLCADDDGDGAGFCEGDPCDGVACAADESCLRGACVAVCHFVSCEDWQACDGSRAGCASTLAASDCCADVSCTNPNVGCEGLCCDAATHGCALCACDTVVCGDGTTCREPGMCVPYCDEPCAEGEFCAGGACVPDCCLDVHCAEGRVCTGCGEEDCELDPCLGVACAAGQLCVAGACAADPCLSLHCPDGTECGCTRAGACGLDDYACYTPIPPPPVPTASIYATGAGGCGCAIGRAP